MHLVTKPFAEINETIGLPTYLPSDHLVTYLLFYQTTMLEKFEKKSKLTNTLVAEFEHSVFYFLCCQTLTSAVLQLQSVMSMQTARILLVLIFVRAKMDTAKMEKHAQVDKHSVPLNNEVRDNVFDTSESTNNRLMANNAVSDHVKKNNLS